MTFSIAILLQDEIPLDQITSLENFSDVQSAGENTAVLSWQGELYTVMQVPTPYPVQELNRQPGDTKPFPDGKAQRAHLIIAPMQPQENLSGRMRQAIFLMQVAQIISEGRTDVAGHVWLSASSFATAEVFNAQALEALATYIDRMEGKQTSIDALPLTFWVTTKTFHDNGQHATRSMGLEAFFGYELELTFAPWTAVESLQILLRLVTYKFESGQSFADGQQMQLAPGQVLLARMHEDARGRTCVLQLQHAAQ